MPLPQLVTPADIAVELNIDARQVRAWLRQNGWRSNFDSGQQWVLTSEELVAVRSAFGSQTASASPRFDAESLTVGEMLHIYTSLLAELRRRGLVRTNNAPIGDLAEYACAAYYEGELAANSEKSYDLIAADGRRVQVKVRTTHGTLSPSSVFSALRSLDFDICLFLIADAQSNVIQTAYEWASDEVKAHGRFQSHTNSTLIRTGQVQSGVAGVNVTVELNLAWQAMLELTGRPKLVVDDIAAGTVDDV